MSKQQKQSKRRVESAPITLSEFKEVFRDYGSDKDSLNHTFAGASYLDVYYKLLRTTMMVRPELQYTILEFGVYEGASIKAWAKLFPNARIIGVDTNSSYFECIQAEPFGDRIELIPGDQADPRLLGDLKKKGPFSLVVDDGSHQYGDMISTFEAIMPHVCSGGYYMIEDCNVGWPSRKWADSGVFNPKLNDPCEWYKFMGTIQHWIDRRSGLVHSITSTYGLVAFERLDETWSPRVE